MKKYLILVFGLLLMITTGCGCPLQTPKETGAFTVTDSLGHEESLKTHPKKVVILSPTLAEMYHEVGGDIAGISYVPGQKYPDYIQKAEHVGLIYNVNIEKVITLKPDIVLGMNFLHNKYADVLKQNHIPFLVFNVSRYDDVKKAISVMSVLANKEKEGRQLLEEAEKQMNEAVNSYPRKEMTYAAIQGTGRGIFLETSGSIVSDVAERLGYSNVFPEVTMNNTGNKPPFSMEELAIKNPDVIFLTTMVHPGEEEAVFEKSLLSQPAWKTLKAVRDGKVYILPQNLFLSSPGLHYSKAVQYMADKVHGETRKIHE